MQIINAFKSQIVPTKIFRYNFIDFPGENRIETSKYADKIHFRKLPRVPVLGAQQSKADARFK